jgi:DNA-binding transcriptional MerR regulator
MLNEQTYTIQEIAQITSLSVHTLRYYERISLIDPVERATNGHRRYNANSIARVEFLNRLRATGMSISQMQKYIALVRQGDASIVERRQMLEEHRCKVLAQIQELQDNLAVIETKIKRYYEQESEFELQRKSELD